MLTITNVRKTFNKGTINEKKALCGLNLHLNPGDFVTVIGGNGAGKSTMLNMIAGVYPIDSGKIEIDGVNISREPEYKRAQYIGRVFQDPMRGTAAGMEIQENLALALRRGRKRGLSWGIKANEKDFYREALTKLGLGLQTRMTSKVGSSFRGTAPGADTSDGDSGKTQAPPSGRAHGGPGSQDRQKGTGADR